MNKVYKRTENGTTTHVSIREGLAEINHAMMAGKKDVREMFEGSTGARITYKDGRRVMLLKVDAPAVINQPPTEDECTCGCRQVKTTARDSEGRRIVTVKGKRYVVSAVTPARPKTEGAATWIPEAYVNYWSGGPLGLPSGPTRSAKASMKPGTVGRAIWDAVNRDAAPDA